MVAAIRSAGGASRRLLVAGLQRRCSLLISVPMVIEYETVLTRPSHLSASGLTVAEVNALLDAVVVVAEPVRLAYRWRPALMDPDDEMVLETAVNGQADRLVSFNLRDFGEAGLQFGIIACAPGDAVKAFESG